MHTASTWETHSAPMWLGRAPLALYQCSSLKEAVTGLKIAPPSRTSESLSNWLLLLQPTRHYYSSKCLHTVEQKSNDVKVAELLERLW